MEGATLSARTFGGEVTIDKCTWKKFVRVPKTIQEFFSKNPKRMKGNIDSGPRKSYDTQPVGPSPREAPHSSVQIVELPELNIESSFHLPSDPLPS